MNGASCACWNCCTGACGNCTWIGWACAVAMAVISAASVKITSAVMTSAAAECQLRTGSPLVGTAGLACG